MKYGDPMESFPYRSVHGDEMLPTVEEEVQVCGYDLGERLERGSDLIRELARAVKSAGLTMTLYGQPVNADELRAAATASAIERIAALVDPFPLPRCHAGAGHGVAAPRGARGVLCDPCNEAVDRLVARLTRKDSAHG